MSVVPVAIFPQFTHRHDGLLLLPESLLAEEDDGGLEDEAHGVQLEPLLDLPQEVGDVQPLHAAVVQQVPGAQVDALKDSYEIR